MTLDRWIGCAALTGAVFLAGCEDDDLAGDAVETGGMENDGGASGVLGGSAGTAAEAASGGPADADSEPTSCADTLVDDGPSGYAFCLEAEAGTSIRWTEDPTADGASAIVESADAEVAILTARLTEDGTVDLSGYDELVLAADVPAGTEFEVRVGSDEAACYYEMVGAGDTNYVVDLAEPGWCEPICGYDLQASVVQLGFGGESLEVRVKELSFETTDGGAGTVQALDAGIGPGGYCWFVTAWSDESQMEFVEPPSVDSAHAIGTSVADDSAVLVMELMDAPVDLTELSRVEFDAIVSSSDEMNVVFNGDSDDAEGCGWDVYPAAAEEGVVTYSIPLGLPDWCYGEPEFDLKSAVWMIFQSSFTPASQLDIEVFDVRFIE